MGWIDLTAAQLALASDKERPGLFERVLGFRTGTQKFRAVHLMNDVGQCVVGGVPAHGGDLLAKVVRVDKEGEGNSDAELRADPKFSGDYSAAFPAKIGERVTQLRRAIALVLNFDGAMFEAGSTMISPLATHRLLLGREGFRRFRVGEYVTSILEQEGRERLRQMLDDDRDAMTRFLGPLLVEAEFTGKSRAGRRPPLSEFDRALGARLTRLLGQPLAKPTLLRYFALGASIGVVLKVFGAGAESGRPILLALAAEKTQGARPLRSEAVQSLQVARERLMDRLAVELQEDLGHGIKIRPSRPREGDPIEVSGTGQRAARALLEALADRGRRAEHDESHEDESAEGESPKAKIAWWPDRFAIHLGRRAGCVWPLADRAGWSSHIVLSPELVEVLTLTEVASGSTPVAWTTFWRNIRTDLGLVVGASPNSDADALRALGVPHLSLQQLRDNAAKLLGFAERRGAARRLPDGGAEILGTHE